MFVNQSTNLLISMRNDTIFNTDIKSIYHFRTKPIDSQTFLLNSVKKILPLWIMSIDNGNKHFIVFLVERQ